MDKNKYPLPDTQPPPSIGQQARESDVPAASCLSPHLGSIAASLLPPTGLDVILALKNS